MHRTVYRMLVTLNGPPAVASAASVPRILTNGASVTLLRETFCPTVLSTERSVQEQHSITRNIFNLRYY